jgi:Fe-S-cluster containining protein
MAEITRQAEIGLTVYGEPVTIKVDIPIGKTTPRRMLPVFRNVCHSIVDAAVGHAEKHGKKVTCAAGCGACCRQLVPISPVEAGMIKDLVDSFAPERKSEILARFSEAESYLRDSGLLSVLERLDKPTGAEYKELGLAYFRLGIPCPFLENESCSIHPDRPLVCREYLVVSPPENCSRQNGEPVEMLKIPGQPSTALAALRQGPEATAWTPLSLALKANEASLDQGTPRSGEEIAKDFFTNILS